ncbi:hypothetical protein BHE74_00004216 [Ensete ventricosum]|nr:hypothetical protein BHE74_00004216 [Ensete ventricosum]
MLYEHGRVVLQCELCYLGIVDGLCRRGPATGSHERPKHVRVGCELRVFLLLSNRGRINGMDAHGFEDPCLWPFDSNQTVLSASRTKYLEHWIRPAVIGPSHQPGNSALPAIGRNGPHDSGNNVSCRQIIG